MRTCLKRGGAVLEGEEEVTIECAHCGNQQLMQAPGAWTLVAIGEGGLMQGPMVPIVPLACPRCGFVEMFSTQMIEPKPFPDPPTPVP